ncbi:MAG: metallophosphoesterase [SAR324 cluster bacterium]|nr:metallophosphoesterase [SAR324 cluster bacterium]
MPSRQRNDHPVSGAALGRHRFTFAVVADSHMNPRDDRTSSPWVTNRLANDRTRHVVHQLNRQQPAFVIHLGDMIHPVPVLPSYAPAAERFHRLLAGLNAPLHLVPGNHDVGDKPVAWMPAGNVSEDNLAQYRRHFGADYYAFDHEDCHFVVINAQIINSGFADEAAQRAWLEQDLEASRDRRIFLCTHYPPYVAERHERSHYDNIDEPGRTWLLGLVERHGMEAVFAGHVHNFFYNRHGATECYILPSIAFVRHDYMEMFRVGPAGEEGRDDADKLGYFLVDVHEHGHIAHTLRTHGATLREGQAPPADGEALPAHLAVRHSKACAFAPLGVDLRHPWAEITEIPYSGALDEFERKKARNDYVLLALWEMGIRKLRLPLHDLLDEITRARMAELHALGHAFTVFSFGVPTGEARERLLAHRGLVDALEVVLRWSEAEASLPGLREIGQKAALPIYLSKLRTSADAERDGSRFHHFINHGFRPDEGETLAAFLGGNGARERPAGFVFRVARGDSPWDDLPAIADLAARLGVRAQVQVRLASDNPAEPMFDERANNNRVAETVAAAWTHPGSEVFLDTLVDLDRGYFPRLGLIDRRCNPRGASRVVTHLQAALETDLKPAQHTAQERGDGQWRAGPAQAVAGGRLCVLLGEQALAALVLPEPRLTVDAVPGALPQGATEGVGRAYDLLSGSIGAFAWRAREASQGGELRMEAALECAVPTLLVFSA